MIRIILLLLLIPCLLFATEVNLEEILDNYGEDSNISLYIEEIQNLIITPLLIDSTKLHNIDNLVFLNQFQIDIIKKVIREDKFTKEYLLSTGSFKNFEIDLIFLCIEIRDVRKDTIQLETTARERFYRKLMPIRGFEPDENDGEPKYEGGNLNSYLKILNSITFGQNQIKFGSVWDNDAGEKDFIDYYTVFAEYSNKDYDIIVGDYYLKRGSGLILSSGFAPRKGTEVIYPAYSSNYSIYPYTSTLESRRFRGASASANILRNFKGADLFVDLFYSNQKRSGNIKETDYGTRYISSVYTSGYYRSDTELSKKNAYSETISGGGLNIKSDYFSIGATALYIDNSLPIYSSSSSAFYGKHGLLKSLYANSEYFENIKLSTEYALDANENSAFIFGTIYKTDFANLTMNIRSYSKGFRTPYGNAFGEFSYPSNEEGVYFGLETKRYYGLQLSTYIDFFASKDSTYYVPDKVNGKEFLANLEYLFLPNNYLSFLYKYEKKTDYGTVSLIDSKVFYDAVKSKYRLQYRGEYKILKQRLRLKTGLEFANFDIPYESSNGMGYYFISKFITNFNLDIGLSYASFDTDDYDSAIWFYEYSLPGYPSILSLYLKGFRISSFIAYSLYDITLSIRLTYLEKPDEKTLSSGWDQTFSPIDRRIYFQLDYPFK